MGDRLICNACNGPKCDDGFKACEKCRFAWRIAKRKPNGLAATIERLERENKDLLYRLSETLKARGG